MTTNVYVVVEGKWGSGDVSGTSVAADRVWFSHISSSTGWLMLDTTGGFLDRRSELDAAYPDGWEAVLIDRSQGQQIPAEIAHYFTAEEEADDATNPNAGT